jgi:glycerol-3-phosphate O-acyltransferase 3/4
MKDDADHFVLWCVFFRVHHFLALSSRLKQAMNNYVNLVSFRIIARALSAVIQFHNRERKAHGGGICVANHTSPIDIVILATDNCYAMVCSLLTAI